MAYLPNRKAGTLRKLITKKVEELKVDEAPFPQTIRLPYKVLPEARDWKSGEKYCLHIEVEQESSDKDGARFEVVKVGVAPDHEGGH